MTTTVLAYFPSPPRGVWYLGPVPIRAYALFIIVGIVVALVIGDRRWEARGGERGVIYDIALWAVPFGLVGGRLYNLATDWRTYFGEGGVGLGAALRVWDGGLGIWGAVALGGVGAWIGCRRRGIPLPAFGDAIAPGIVLAQAIGRLGNYFNQELYGRETTMPWGLEIFWRQDASGGRGPNLLDGVSTGQLYAIVQPTFLYELLWNVLVFVALIYVDRHFRIGHGRLFALYVAGYCVGRFCIELLRDDTATHIAGIRINSFTSTFVFIGAVVYLILAPKGREDPATLGGAAAEGLQVEPEPAPELVTAAVPTAAAETEKPTESGAAPEAAQAVEPDEAETTSTPLPEVETEAVATAAEETEQPEVEQAKAVESEAEEPEVAEPEAEEPEAVAPEEPEAEEVGAEASATALVDADEPKVGEAEEPEVAEPEVAEAEGPEAEAPEAPEGEEVEDEAIATAAEEPEPEVEDIETGDIAREADEEGAAVGDDEVVAEAEDVAQEAGPDEAAANTEAEEPVAQMTEPTSPSPGRWRSRLSRLKRRSAQ